MSITLIPNDSNIGISLDVNLITISNVIREMSCNSHEVHLEQVNNRSLIKIVEFMKYKYSNNESTEWENEFCKIENDFLTELILAAEYLELKSLTNILIKNISNMLRGKSDEYIRDFFDLH